MTARLVDETGNALELERRLGRGGEGEVHSVVGAPSLVAKLLFPSSRTAGRIDKVRAMIARPPTGAYDLVEDLPVLTWPRTLLYEGSGSRGRGPPTGYTMARVHERDFVPFYRITSPSRRRELGGVAVTWDRLVLLGIRLCHVVRTLHRLDYAVGDLNDRNVLVSRRFTPLFMDTDSFQVPRPGGGHFPCVVGDQMYWPPEHLEVDYATFRGSRVTGDRFALGVLLFQLYMGGLRPYQARGSLVDGLESVVDKTRDGHYPWRSPRPGILEPPAGAPDYENLPGPIRDAFERCFVKGHRKPNRRPSADDWYKVLLRVRDAGFQTCARHPGHVYGKDERECPWCQDPYNPFGLAGGRMPPARKPPPPRPVPKPKPVEKPPPAPPRPSRAPPARKAQAKVARGAKAAAKKPPRTLAAEPPKPSPAKQQVLRLAWLAAVLAACTTPLLVLPLLPMVPAKQVALFALTTLWIGSGLSVATWGRTSARAAPAIAALYVALGAVATVLAARTLGWPTLDYANAAGAAGLGAATFFLLERKRPRAFWPRPRGFLHALLAILAAHLPVAAVWLATRL